MLVPAPAVRYREGIRTSQERHPITGTVCTSLFSPNTACERSTWTSATSKSAFGRIRLQRATGSTIYNHVPGILCPVCQGASIESYRFCRSCRLPADGRQPVPRTVEVATTIPEKSQARIDEVRGVLENMPGQKQKIRAADSSDEFLRARTEGRRGWASGADVDVLECMCWLDSQGRGTKGVHTTDCRGIGTDSDARCNAGLGCARHYAAGSLARACSANLEAHWPNFSGSTRSGTESSNEETRRRVRWRERTSPIRWKSNAGVVCRSGKPRRCWWLTFGGWWPT